MEGPDAGGGRAGAGLGFYQAARNLHPVLITSLAESRQMPEVGLISASDDLADAVLLTYSGAV
jgi:hypothetical protein